MRPVELARDDTPTLPVLQHAVHYLEANGDRLDAICLLQPTHPFRTAEEIDACIERLEQTDADAVMTVSLIPHEYNPHWAYWMNTDGALHLSTGETNPIPRRQALPPAYHREGSVYVTRRDVLVNQNTLYGNRVIGYPVDKAHRINIDTLDDFHRAELEMQRRQLKDA
jgi:CMP-N-acetylneuraminic acid synthetase